jgi:hypothetical protein
MIRALLVAATLLCGAGALSAETLPGTAGENLLGQKVKIAESLQGKVGVLVVGYSKASGDILSAWERRLSADFAGRPEVVVYQIPILEGAPKFIRGMIVNGMRKGVPAPKQANFIVVVNDEDQWKRICGYQKGDDAYIVIVDKSGEIRQHGAVDAKLSSYSAVQEQIQELISQ